MCGSGRGCHIRASLGFELLVYWLDGFLCTWPLIGCSIDEITRLKALNTSGGERCITIFCCDGVFLYPIILPGKVHKIGPPIPRGGGKIVGEGICCVCARKHPKIVKILIFCWVNVSFHTWISLWEVCVCFVVVTHCDYNLALGPVVCVWYGLVENIKGGSIRALEDNLLEKTLEALTWDGDSRCLACRGEECCLKFESGFRTNGKRDVETAVFVSLVHRLCFL
mmetsp:Transcript_11458/g.17333  ORF Transcript_11458/g.17333 Transcript_11458/m.17333 type:complete len:224 (+) Transcript_11458:50-721(+)